MSSLNIIVLPHFWIILIGVILLSLGVLFVTIHKPKGWFFLHRLFSLGGIILVILGIFLLTGLYTNVLIHRILGIIAIIWLIGEVIGGLVAYMKKNPQMRKIHVLSGRLALIMVIFVIIIGLIIVSISTI
jgi:hypothetical protein